MFKTSESAAARTIKRVADVLGPESEFSKVGLHILECPINDLPEALKLVEGSKIGSESKEILVAAIANRKTEDIQHKIVTYSGTELLTLLSEIDHAVSLDIIWPKLGEILTNQVRERVTRLLPPDVLELGSVYKLVDTFLNSHADTNFDDLELTELRSLYGEAKELHRSIEEMIDWMPETIQGKPRYELLNDLFPDRYSKASSLKSIMYQTLDRLPLQTLSLTELDDYVISLSDVNKLILNQDYDNENVKLGGYYFFGMNDESYGELPVWQVLRRSVMDNPDKKLTPEQENIVQKEEDNVYKLHLQFDTAQWKQVLKIIASARIPLLNKWKILPPHKSGGELPTIVVYPDPNKTMNSEQVLEVITDQLMALLEQNGVELKSAATPRFSTPVLDEAQQAVPGFYFVQGDGDWKKYLERQGKLDDVYQADLNYAVRGERP